MRCAEAPEEGGMLEQGGRFKVLCHHPCGGVHLDDVGTPLMAR